MGKISRNVLIQKPFFPHKQESDINSKKKGVQIRQKKENFMLPYQFNPNMSWER